MKGLKPEIQELTRLVELADLNAAITQAKRVEGVKNWTLQNTLNRQINKKGMEELLREHTTPYQNKQDPIFQRIQKPVEDNQVEDLIGEMANESTNGKFTI